MVHQQVGVADALDTVNRSRPRRACLTWTDALFVVLAGLRPSGSTVIQPQLALAVCPSVQFLLTLWTHRYGHNSSQSKGLPTANQRS